MRVSTKLVYRCHYDGEVCDKEIPKIDEKGNILRPKEPNIPTVDCRGKWETCMKCERNHCASGTCFGKLDIVGDYVKEK